MLLLKKLNSNTFLQKASSLRDIALACSVYLTSVGGCKVRQKYYVLCSISVQASMGFNSSWCDVRDRQRNSTVFASIHSRVEWFSTFFDFWKPALFCWSGIFLRTQFKKIGNFGCTLTYHARQSFLFQKIPGTLKINNFFENL